MEGKTVLITGSTSGIGLEAAKKFYSLGANVILTCRDGTRGRNAIDAVQSSSEKQDEDSTQRLHLLSLDLMVYETIIEFCDEVKAQFDKIDVLVLNAGVFAKSFELSSDGIESHFATNMFGHYVIVNHLVPLLEAASGRIIVVTSSLYKGVNSLPNIRQLMGEQLWDYRWRYAYGVSKLTNCIYTMELSRRMKVANKSVQVFAVHPGFIRGTELGREYHWFLRKLGAPLIFFFSKPVEKGAEPIVQLASTNVDELTPGALYNKFCQMEDYNSMVNTATSNWLWDLLAQMETLILRRGNFTQQIIDSAQAGRRFATGQ